MHPYLAGEWPKEPGRSAVENQGILMNVHSTFDPMAYGIEELRRRNPLACPRLRDRRGGRGLPVNIAVDELDPLRGDGVEFYRLLLRAGVSARCRQQTGSVHDTEIYVICLRTSVATQHAISRLQAPIECSYLCNTQVAYIYGIRRCCVAA
jgi:acetyl esterase